jgi:hypothetical protein
VEQVAAYLAADLSANNVGTALAARRGALEDVVRAVSSLYYEAKPFSESPPGYPMKDQAKKL